MKILMVSHYFKPHIGGVEKHVEKISELLRKKGHKVKVISKYDIKYPEIKFIGLIYIWLWFLKNRNLIEKSNIIHIHDVFIWYLPFRFLYPYKKVITTFHGLEWDNPLNELSILQKRLACALSTKTIGVGRFLEKYLKVNFNLITYGGYDKIGVKNTGKEDNCFLFLGRLEENTGLLEFLKWLKTYKRKKSVWFVGDGRLRQDCEKYGKVYGFTNPNPFLSKTEYTIPAGYLAALEALSFGCKLKLFWNNKIKEDYWKISPFIRRDAISWSKLQTWDKLTNEYLDLYNSI